MLHNMTHKIHGQKSANTTHHRGQRACCVLRDVLAVVIQRRSNSCIFIHDCPFFLIAFFVFLPLLLPRKLQIFIIIPLEYCLRAAVVRLLLPPGWQNDCVTSFSLDVRGLADLGH